MDFTGDYCKMYDFCKLSKKQFLESYSYITEEEYEATVDAVLRCFGGDSAEFDDMEDL